MLSTYTLTDEQRRISSFPADFKKTTFVKSDFYTAAATTGFQINGDYTLRISTSNLRREPTELTTLGYGYSLNHRFMY
jgi:hypothetical protein